MAGKAPKATPRVINREAGNGRFVTEQYVKNHPKTTVTETVSRPKSK